MITPAEFFKDFSENLNHLYFVFILYLICSTSITSEKNIFRAYTVYFCLYTQWQVLDCWQLAEVFCICP